VRGFLQDIALVSDADGYDDATPKVALMTLHAAKGLEFPVVFIAGVEEDLLPHKRARSPGASSAIEEERRLFYVGMTRAQDQCSCSPRGHAPPLRRRDLVPAVALPRRDPRELVAGQGGAEDEAHDARRLRVRTRMPRARRELAVGDTVEHDFFGRGKVELLRGRRRERARDDLVRPASAASS
jgi:hypothetical protein